jgi:pyrroline-5-carboxylate reductase
MAKIQLGIIGCGNMGEAILRRLLEVGTWRFSVVVSEQDPEKRKRVEAGYRVRVIRDNFSLAKACTVIVLAVKPHDIDGVLREISGPHLSSRLIISIAAGVSTQRIEGLLKAKAPVVRVMPNMPALVGEGISAMCGGSFAKAPHLKIAKAVFSCIGNVVEIDEAFMDAVTAVSGSGPAYFFYLVQCIIEAAQELGLSERDASVLAVKTALGSAHVLDKLGESPESLRHKVTSKGGTTEAAFKVFESKGLKDIVKEGVRAARDRARELSAE